MAAPQAIGPQVDSGVTVYYVPPPGQTPNVATAFWSGFFKQRMPIAREVFLQRLRQMQPADRSAEIADMLKTKQKLMSDLLEYQRASERLASEGRRQDYSLLQTYLGGEYGLAQAKTKANADIIQTEAKLDLERQQIRELPPEVDARWDDTMAILREEASKGTDTSAEEVDAILNGFMAYAKDGFTKITPAQEGTLRERMLREVANLAQVNPEAAKFVPGLRTNIETSFSEFAPVPDEPLERAGGSSAGIEQARRELGPRLQEALTPQGGGSVGYSRGGTVPAGGGAGGGSAPGFEDNPLMRQIDDYIKQLQGEHGKTPEVDFTAPVIKKDAGFPQPASTLFDMFDRRDLNDKNPREYAEVARTMPRDGGSYDDLLTEAPPPTAASRQVPPAAAESERKLSWPTKEEVMDFDQLEDPASTPDTEDAVLSILGRERQKRRSRQ